MIKIMEKWSPPQGGETTMSNEIILFGFGIICFILGLGLRSARFLHENENVPHIPTHVKVYGEWRKIGPPDIHGFREFDNEK